MLPSWTTASVIEPMEILSAMDDVVTLDELIERYRRERESPESPLVRAAAALSWARDRLDDDATDFLVRKGALLLRREGIPEEFQLSPQLAARIQDRSKTGNLMIKSAYRAYLARQPDAHDGAGRDAVADEDDEDSEAVIYFDPYTDGNERMVVPASDLTTLMSAALVSVEPVRSRRERDRSRREDVEDGKISDRALTELEYSRRYDVGGEVVAFLVIGWLPGAFAGIIAGIIVALITSDWVLLLPIALGAAILGYLLTVGLDVLFGMADVRWLRCGYRGSAPVIIFLVTGPAVALLLAFLVLSAFS